ncbi:hypothetical protein [Bradyrhizobium elkanii]|uniref:hypothetical protein n=1 Tax=Bradyrhizobium elkanii TaxID=29448 RepID=UPI00209DBDCC|nr:hypothetical protein [Bradyrhizobium elkanii]MCP1970830.1 hypothetical protein [Bradyrhizobium elkanii]MCS4107663.1 hypothetical protein [Bradyrhizobium elkanii]
MTLKEKALNWNAVWRFPRRLTLVLGGLDFHLLLKLREHALHFRIAEARRTACCFDMQSSANS